MTSATPSTSASQAIHERACKNQYHTTYICINSKLSSFCIFLYNKKN